MKKIISLSIVICLMVFFCAFNMLSTGIAGETGAPGEGGCFCHGSPSAGGPSGTKGTTVSITGTPSFTNNLYVPNITYTVSLSSAKPPPPLQEREYVVVNAG